MGNNSGNFEDTEILKTGNKTTCNEEYFSLEGFFISTLLHAEKRSLKSPLFKFEKKNKKMTLTQGHIAQKL